MNKQQKQRAELNNSTDLNSLLILHDMKAKFAMHKSRSPPKFDFSHEGEVIEEFDDGKQRRQIPNIFLVNKKPGRLTRNGTSNVTSPLYRKVRSNSPRINPQKSTPNLKQPTNYHSPICKQNQPLEVSRNKGININTSYKTKGRVSRKGSPDIEKQRAKANSPRLGHCAENEEIKALKVFAKRKHKLNKELWEAAENGNLAKITQLLDEYY